VLGAFDASGELVGVVGMDVDPRRKVRHRGHVFGMYVPAESRRAGVGRSLLEALIARARGVPGLEALTLSVTAGNAAARALYERAGFVAWGTDRAAIRVGAAAFDKVHMTMRLSPLSQSATEAR
jgi:RimJ/RimL family protein N-acetyltransferase